jgi:hypothetical protein
MKPVHTFMLMVQCPLCRYTFMRHGDACCWRCAPPEGPPTREELATARRIREAVDVEVGSAGSLAGLGFAPLGTTLPVFETPHRPDTEDSDSTSRVTFWSVACAIGVVCELWYLAHLLVQAAHRNGWLVR